MKKLKDNKGFTQVDITISIIILICFVTLIASLFYNSYVTSTKTKRDSEEAAYLTQILQKIDLIDYDNLNNNENGIVAEINKIDNSQITGEYVDNIDAESTLSTPYKAQVKIENYNKLEGNEQKEDLIKIITVKVSYINQKGQALTAQRLKTKDTIYEDSLEIIPEIKEGMVPLSSVEEKQATTKYASNWFDYSNEKVAQITLNDALAIDDQTGKINNLGSEFIYIPRFAYEISEDENGNITTNIKFINSDNTCKDGSSTNINKETDQIEHNKYYVPKVFTQENIELKGLWIGKYLCKKDVNGIDEYISVTSAQNNSELWTGLTEAQKQEKIEKFTQSQNIYGLAENTNVKIVDENINEIINKLKTSKYAFIANSINEDETQYAGSFRIYMY